MFQEMRRKDRALTGEEAAALLRDGEWGVLSMNAMEDSGYAYGVPLSYVYDGKCIYFHCAMEGEKLERIRRHNKVSFCVVGETQTLAEKFSLKYYSVVVFGQAEEVDGEERDRALLALVDKYSPDFKEKGKVYAEKSGHETKVVRLEVAHITGKARKS